jgi:presequence protease
VYFYGDDDEAARLDLVARAFAGYGRGSRAPAIPMQPRWSSPRVVRERYAAGADPASSKTMLAVNWLLGDHLDPERSLALNILSHILLGTPAAPLRRALIESGLGEGLTGSGLDDENREAVFAVGLKGIEGARAAEVEELIRGTLAGLARDGIDPEAVAAGMNSVEFMLRENNTGSYPRGLALMIRCLPSWMYTGDPFLSLAFEAPLRSLRRRLERGERVFEDLVRMELVDNRHNLVVLLEPDPELGARIERDEEARLAATAAALRDEEVREIERRAEELERFQSTPDSPEALATIPSLRLDDIDRVSRRIPMEIVKRGETTFLVHEIPTAGIVYLDVGFDLRGLDADLLPYLPLYARCLTEMGTARTDYVRLQQRIGRDTGGVAATLMVSSVVGTDKAAAWLFLRGKALVAELDKLLGIVTEVLTQPALDNRARFGQMARESKARMESSVVPSGHSVVSSRLASKFDEAAWVRERMGGVDYLLAVRELAGRVQSDWPAVLAALERIHSAVVTRRGALCNVTVTRSERAAVMARLEELPARLPDHARAAGGWSPDWRRYDEGLTAPSQVNYAGKGGSLFDCGYRLRGSLFAVLNYVRATWIHEQVRVQGGAYGGMVQFDPVSGFLGYLSYRDPNLLSTLKAYDGTPAFLKEARIDSDELRRNIIGAIGDLDPCLLPDAQGYTSLRRYVAGVTDAERQRLRDELLGTTEADFRDLAEPLRVLAERGTVVALGSPERIAEANTALGNRLHVTALL